MRLLPQRSRPLLTGSRMHKPAVSDDVPHCPCIMKNALTSTSDALSPTRRCRVWRVCCVCMGARLYTARRSSPHRQHSMHVAGEGNGQWGHIVGEDLGICVYNRTGLVFQTIFAPSCSPQEMFV